ncbi:MAG: threonine--tRNA ligase [Candidatus Omnitrophota bacterium]|nr:threonine--tRNA ligase [Candidatus Omnitrophota bacterium]
MAKNKDEQLETIRHSAAHVMADAVQRLYPGVKLGMGPAIEGGFYYDFDFRECDNETTENPRHKFLVPDDLPKIEEEMARIIEQDLAFEQESVPKEEAKKRFSEENEMYKIELLDGLEDAEVSLYRHGGFTDLCRGPHVRRTREIGAFKLLSVAGAYWKGDESNVMLQRIYGTAFKDEKSLEEFLALREEAQKRDHRKLGKELDLFSFSEIMGAGLVLYHPKGAILRQVVVDYITAKHLEKKYKLISSPHILKSDIWIRSGHYDYYKEHMYIFETEGQEYAVKPMNCPGHILVYSSKTRSYKEFPIRYFELGTVYRHEKSGVLHGLLRVRGFTQDDAHIFCLQDQVEKEVVNVIDFVTETLKDFGFDDFEVELSTKPEKYIGSGKDWEKATKALKTALEYKRMNYEINEGEGAFYGPKIDIKIKDALGREWQCATIQCDFALPERFDLKYIDQNGEERRPIVLHRVILGSLERFIGALIEQYGGAFPLWLAPVQVKIIPITEDQSSYAQELEDGFHKAGIRVETDVRSEKMQKKIRDAEIQKIPYMAIIGKKEMSEKTVSVRSRKHGDIGALTKQDFVERLREEDRNRERAIA